MLWPSGFQRYRGRLPRTELCPSAADFASTSAPSFPSIPMCPADHLNVSLNLPLCLQALSCLIDWKIFAAMCCPGFVMSVLAAFRAAWLPTLITHFTFTLHSVFSR